MLRSESLRVDGWETEVRSNGHRRRSVARGRIRQLGQEKQESMVKNERSVLMQLDGQKSRACAT